MTSNIFHDGHKDTCPMGELLNDDPLDHRTLCRLCAETGSATPLDPTIFTTGGKQDAVDAIHMHSAALGLGQWTVRLAEGFDESLGEDAYVRVEHRELVATIFVNPVASPEQAERLIVHELLHLTMYDLQRLAMNDETIPMMDLVDLELERVINRIAQAITGVPWEPIAPSVRKLHEYDCD